MDERKGHEQKGSERTGVGKERSEDVQKEAGKQGHLYRKELRKRGDTEEKRKLDREAEKKRRKVGGREERKGKRGKRKYRRWVIN